MASKSQELETLILGLPSELQQLILRVACSLSIDFCVVFSGLSSWTRKLASEYLLSVGTIQTPKAYSSFLSAICGPIRASPSLDPSAFVRNLWLSPHIGDPSPIFSRCQNLVNLAIPEDIFFWLTYFATLPMLFTKPTWTPRPNLGLKILVLEANTVFWSAQRHKNNDVILPIFACTTHLHLGAIGTSEMHLDLQHFKRLSHVALPYHLPATQTQQCILSVLQTETVSFVVVILHTDRLTEQECKSALNWVLVTRKTNQKLYALCSRHEDLLKEWEAEARGGSDVFERAQEFIRSLSQ